MDTTTSRDADHRAAAFHPGPGVAVLVCHCGEAVDLADLRRQAPEHDEDTNPARIRRIVCPAHEYPHHPPAAPHRTWEESPWLTPRMRAALAAHDDSGRVVGPNTLVARLVRLGLVEHPTYARIGRDQRATAVLTAAGRAEVARDPAPDPDDDTVAS
jgi:hypothetical protein